MKNERIGIIGGGIIGLAVARRLGQLRSDASITVIDKEDTVGSHQTSHNSGVVHAGLYYAPDSLKAILCRRGGAMLREYCAEKSIPYQECGKLIIAIDESEVEALNRIQKRSELNQVKGLVRIGVEGISELEPNAIGFAGLHSPHTAITDYLEVARAFAADVVASGVAVVVVIVIVVLLAARRVSIIVTHCYSC